MSPVDSSAARGVDAPQPVVPGEAADGAYAEEVEVVAAALGCDLRAGLGSDEAARRLLQHGPNRLRPQSRPSYLRLTARQFTDPLVALLVVAAAVAAWAGDRVEGIVIAAIIVLDAALGLTQELGAERAIRALSDRFDQRAVVVRGGHEQEIAAAEVVVGDLVVLREGDRAPADARVVAATRLEVDESALTGESFPVEKGPGGVAVGCSLGDRTSMVFAGTGITHGHGTAVVTAIGSATELGQIERLASSARPPATPLQSRMARLARQLALAGVALTLLLATAMLLQGSSLRAAFLLGVAVAVAAVPEGLAATVTAALALGGRAMAHQGAIVRRLEAVETLGGATVVCTDKTGTLTENSIRVASLAPASGLSESDLLVAGVLATSGRAGVRAGTAVGDPVDRALLLAAMERGLSREVLLHDRERVHELPFDSEKRMMAAVYAEADGRRRLVAKGAPEVLFDLSASVDPRLERAVDEWTAEGFRVLAFADRWLEHGAPLSHAVDPGLRLIGVIAFHDPLRDGVADAIVAARGAGIEVRVVTGDHPATARSIARSLGIAPDAVLARATPADKLRLVEELQARGEVVAVTGDGVNDAPALRRADVGIAMGRGGTEAAREAAGIVLTDDDFTTIVRAIEEGRRIGDNIRSFVSFLLSANLGEVLVIAVAVVAGLGAPLAVVQVLLVNLVTDGLPAVALARDPASLRTMSRQPRRALELLDREAWARVLVGGALVGTTALGAFLLGRDDGTQTAQTMAYATLALAELVLVYAIRAGGVPAWRAARNAWLDLSVVASALFVACTIYVPPLHGAFATTGLGLSQALAVVGLAAAPALILEGAKAIRRRSSAGGGER